MPWSTSIPFTTGLRIILPLNIIRTENPFQKTNPGPTQRTQPLDSFPHSLSREAESLSMIQNKEFFADIRVFTIVKEVVDVRVWKRKVTTQGPQRTTGEEFWGRLASVSPGGSEVTAVRKTSWV